MQPTHGTPIAESATHALDEYLAAAEAGTAPPRAEFLARYPELADDLDACLSALDFIGRAGEGPRAVTAELAEAQPAEQIVGQLGDFRLIREVGRGGMGVVYEAEQQSLNRNVALKVLPFAAALDARQLQRFKNEAQAAACLHHPHIVPVFGVGCERGVHYYAMQLIDGQTLAAMIAALRQPDGEPVQPDAQPTTSQVHGAPAPATDTSPRAAASTERTPRDLAYFRRMAELGIQAADALEHAHALGIVHRDVKPGNLMLDGRGSLWVTDFGLAFIQNDARLTMTGDLVGTLRYMSPEQALAKRVVVDHRTDIYSLGATLYEMLTLEPVFAGHDRQELLRQIAFEEPRPARRINKAIPVELATMVQKAMEKNPADRYGTAQEVADDLRRFLADEPIRARPAGLLRRVRKLCRRHQGAVTAGAVGALLIVMTLIGMAAWVLGERASRHDRVREALEAAAPRLREGNPWDPTLTAAVQRAEAQQSGGLLAEELARQVDQLQKDVHMLAVIETIRLGPTDVGRIGRFDLAHADTAYANAFFAYGIDLEGLAPDQAAALVEGSAIRIHLVAALDDWAWCLGRVSARNVTSSRSRQLAAVARLADPDSWRNKLRAAVLDNGYKAIEELARSAPVEELPVTTLGSLAQLIMGDLAPNKRAHTSDLVVTLLRRAQQRFPADFWINHTLAMALHSTKPVQLDTAIGYFRVAVALRPQSPGARQNLGSVLRDKGDMEGAIAEHREALRLGPKIALAPMVHNSLGLALNGKGRGDEAIAEYWEAIRLKPEYAAAHNNLGVALLDNGRVDEAVAAFQEAIRLDHDHALAHVNLGAALHRKGRQDDATAELQEAIRLSPELAEAHDGFGAALQFAGRLEEAISAHKEAIRLKPELAVAHYNLGNVLRDKGRLDEAIAEFREATRLKPNDVKAHYNLGNALRDKGRLDDAITEFQEAIRLEPDDAKARYNLGNALRDKGRLDDAITEFQEAIRLKHDYGMAHMNLGNALRGKGRLDEAITAYREAIRLNPVDAKAHYNLGKAFGDMGRRDEAIARYQEAIRLDPAYAEAHNNLGNALTDKGRLNEAITALKEAIRLKPQLAAAHYNLGNALYGNRQLDEAINEFREALRLKADDADIHNNLGNTLRAKGRPDEAITEFQQAIRLKPEHWLGHYNLGSALRDKGRQNEAITELHEAIRLNSNYAEAHCNLGHTLRDRGQFADALASLRRGHELGSRRPGWRYPSAQWAKECARLVELDKKLVSVLKGDIQPDDAGDRVLLAQHCQLAAKSLHADAVRFYTAAFAEQPSLFAQHRYNAACAATLAGTADSGKGPAALPGAPALRRQARAWLQASLDMRRQQLERGNDAILQTVEELAHWKRDTDLVAVRDARSLARLPDAEQVAWGKLWTGVDLVLAQARSRITEITHAGTLSDKQPDQIHEMKLEAGVHYVFDMKSSAFDSYLKLHDAAGKLLDEKDDVAPNNLDARIVFTPKAAGVYRITATSFEQRGRGAYTLTIRAVGK